MIKIDIKGMAELQSKLKGFERQVRYAAARALTATAKAAEADIGKRIGSVFDRPTPWIQRGTFVSPATRDKLEAVVGIKNQGARNQARYLREHFDAGARSNKPMEKAMRGAGILPLGWLVVPSPGGVQLDAHGNVSRATVGRILAGLKPGAVARRGDDQHLLFVVKPGQVRTRHLAPGIWSASRVGGTNVIKPVFLFVQRATYRKVLDLPQIVGDVVRREFPRRFGEAFQSAMASAR